MHPLSFKTMDFLDSLCIADFLICWFDLIWFLFSWWVISKKDSSTSIHQSLSQLEEKYISSICMYFCVCILWSRVQKADTMGFLSSPQFIFSLYWKQKECGRL